MSEILDGRFRFIADKKKGLIYDKARNGFVDRFGNLWKKGPFHGDPKSNFPYEWDVQLSEKGMNTWGKFIKNNKGYINVRHDGSLSH